jgi:predicted RNase H-like HicB family nuclease
MKVKVREFTGVFKKVKGGYTAWAEELPGANTQGKTLAEAKDNLRDAIELMLETNRAMESFDSTLHRLPLKISIPA